MNTGDLILYAALGLALLSILLLARNVKHVRWIVRLFVLLLSIDLALLIFYFATTQLTINYVWTFTSRELALIYKIMGALAGQQGTSLYWAFLISLQSLWLSERNDEPHDFIKKTQIILLVIGSSFIGLTLLDSPFLTIYEVYPDIPRSFVPADGAGLNPLLVNPWMAVHPPIIFIGYATMTIPFSLAIVYFITSIRASSSEDTHRIWIRNAIPWVRISWLFLFLGIAIGGVWSYEVLGWGGFWAWDPVETSSLIPWLFLTAALHSFIDHRTERKKFSILNPTLIAFSFVFILYGSWVTRSGLFESLHSFGSGIGSIYLLALISITAFFTVSLAVLSYLRSKKIGRHDERFVFLSRTNILYIAVALFLILAYISFWGITFPAIDALSTGARVSITREFFDIWNGPFIIALMLLLGFGLTYKRSETKNQLKLFFVFTLLTIIAAAIRPSESWSYLHYSGIAGGEKPFPYALIASASVLSIVPPMAYVFYAVAARTYSRVKTARRLRYRMKEIGIIMVHLGVVFVVIGWAFSANFTTEFSTVLNAYDEREVGAMSNALYNVKLLDYDVRADFDKVELHVLGLSLTEFSVKLRDDINSGSVKSSYTVHGVVDDVVEAGSSLSYVRLVEGQRELWIVTERTTPVMHTVIVVTGTPIFGFESTSLNKTFDVILFSTKEDIASPVSTTKIVRVTERVALAIYEGDMRIAEGTAEKIRYEQGVAYRVMIERGIMRDIYVIFTGAEGDTGIAPVTVRIIPMMTALWIGIILFPAGMMLVFLFDMRYQTKYREKLTES